MKRKEELGTLVTVLVILSIIALLHFFGGQPCAGQQGDGGACALDQKLESI